VILRKFLPEKVALIIAYWLGRETGRPAPVFLKIAGTRVLLTGK
jgi:hypothetical protein